jgi:biopolymer transport protein ExbD
MAGGGGPPVPEGGGEKKAIDFNLNLVPFIDLMSAMISFLLITAVWMDVRQKPNLSGPEDTPTRPDERLDLTVLVKSTGYTVSTRGTVLREIARKGEAYDVATLGETLEAAPR